MAKKRQNKGIVFHRETPVRHEVDVFIAGGGPAGVAAAVAARRQGVSVFLAEGHSCFGGMGTAALVPAFMQFGDGVNFLAGGIGQEILTRLRTAGGTGLDDSVENSNDDCVGIKVEVLKRVYDELITETGVDFTFQTVLIGVETEGDRVAAAVCAAKSGIFAVKAKIYIDCTGDGDLAAWAGATFEKGDEQGNLMPGTLCSLWAGMDWDVVKSSGLGSGNKRMEEAFKDGVFTIQDHHLPGIWPVGRIIGGGNIGHTFGVDGTDERSLTEALVQGRKSMLEYERYYKEYLRGFEKMELVSTGSLLGLRETRRIMGDYVLSLDDFHSRAVFDDEIGRYSYPVDIHPSSPDKANHDKFLDEFTNLRYQRGESYGIPYRCLVPRELSNLLVAGRCLSADRYLQGSVRVMPGCYITGQAVGVAASLAVEYETDTRSINVTELQNRLVGMGAYLPNVAVVQ
ncbi:MAG: FAD-dependent oxidoreductase [Planctomycetota bacterium]|nr:FAD-dependent oxidoreductase [Planctomycetota bacterium]